MHYRIVRPADPAQAVVLDAALASFAADKRMQADRVKLERACWSPEKLVIVKGAPRPAVLA